MKLMICHSDIAVIGKAMGAEVLYIADFIKTSCERPSDAELRTAFEIFDSRFSVGLQTLISSKFSTSELMWFD